MWDLLVEVLRAEGFVALVVGGVVLGLAFGVSKLWARILDLEREKAEAVAAAEKARTDAQKAHAAIIERYETRLGSVAGDRQRDALMFAEKLEELQEKRVNDTTAIIREAITHISETRNSVERIADAVQTLRAVILSE